MRLAPAAIQLIGSEIALKWNDGAESFLPLEALRRACPCAACGGEADLLGHGGKPSVSYSPASFELRGWEIIGGYAIQFTWGDGHQTGLYAYPMLRDAEKSLSGGIAE